MTTVLLDTGALIGLERNDRRVVAIIVRALEHHDPIVVPAGVVAQAWRDGSRQTRLAIFFGLLFCEVPAFGDFEGRAAGQLCGLAMTIDVSDASVAIAARDRAARVLTSDLDDLCFLIIASRSFPSDSRAQTQGGQVTATLLQPRDPRASVVSRGHCTSTTAGLTSNPGSSMISAARPAFSLRRSANTTCFPALARRAFA